jgi:hypothetical protein
LLEMSTNYQIVFSSRSTIQDPEGENRFYKKRDLSNTPQSQWMFEIFKESMNAKVQAFAIVGIIFLSATIYFFDIVIHDEEKVAK